MSREESPEEEARRKKTARVIQIVSLFLFVIGLMGMAGVFSSGCKTKSAKWRRTDRGRRVISDLEFRKHKKSGLCFAIYGEAHGAVLAHVPCERVKHLVKEGE